MGKTFFNGFFDPVLMHPELLIIINPQQTINKALKHVFKILNNNILYSIKKKRQIDIRFMGLRKSLVTFLLENIGKNLSIIFTFKKIHFSLPITL